MGWNLEGQLVEASYMGEFNVDGLVVESRIKFGGHIQHTIQLTEPITVYGRVANKLLIDQRDIVAMLS